MVFGHGGGKKADALLRKPFDLPALSEKVRDALDRRAPAARKMTRVEASRKAPRSPAHSETAVT
jgi:DNA-binding response OmpR family regulator